MQSTDQWSNQSINQSINVLTCIYDLDCVLCYSWLTSVSPWINVLTVLYFWPWPCVTFMLQLADIGIPLDQVLWSRVTMTSDRWIAVRHDNKDEKRSMVSQIYENACLQCISITYLFIILHHTSTQNGCTCNKLSAFNHFFLVLVYLSFISTVIWFCEFVMEELYLLKLLFHRAQQIRFNEL